MERMAPNFASELWNHFEFFHKLGFVWCGTPASCYPYHVMGPTWPRFWVLTHRNSKCILSFGVEFIFFDIISRNILLKMSIISMMKIAWVILIICVFYILFIMFTGHSAPTRRFPHSTPKRFKQESVRTQRTDWRMDARTDATKHIYLPSFAVDN